MYNHQWADKADKAGWAALVHLSQEPFEWSLENFGLSQIVFSLKEKKPNVVCALSVLQAHEGDVIGTWRYMFTHLIRPHVLSCSLQHNTPQNDLCTAAGYSISCFVQTIHGIILNLWCWTSFYDDTVWKPCLFWPHDHVLCDRKALEWHVQ